MPPTDVRLQRTFVRSISGQLRTIPVRSVWVQGIPEGAPEVDELGELVTLRQARDLLGVSADTITAMVKDGRLTTYIRPADRRRKFVKREQIDEIMRPRLERGEARQTA